LSLGVQVLLELHEHHADLPRRPRSATAAEEWQAGRAVDEDNAQRELRQFVWCLPVVPSKLAQTNLEAHELAGRMTELPEGVVPEDVEYFTAGIDLDTYLAGCVVAAWSP
jgi:hypothetical protein